MRVVVVLGVLAIAGSAHAQGPITARVGLGLGADEWGSGSGGIQLYEDPAYDSDAVLELEVGYKLRPDLALTVRASISSLHHATEFLFCDDPFPGQSETEPMQWRSRTIGFGVTYAATDKLWISPWLGVVSIAVRNTYGGISPMFGGGVDVGYDFATWENHRLGGFVGASHGGDFNTTNDPGKSPGEYQLAIGVAYRFW